MFAYPCPSCRQRLLAPPSRVGQRSICPKCLHPLTVPHPEQVTAAGPFSPVPDPTPDEPYQPRSIFDLPDSAGEPHGETPAPMNTMPARTGEYADLERAEPITEPFLDLPPVMADPPAPTDLEPVALVLPEAPAQAKPMPLAHTPTPAAPPSSRRLARPHDGRVMFDAGGLFGGDAVAQLSAAISMRMAPPPLPTTDRTYAVIGWVTGTLVGLGVWVLGVWQAAGWLPYVALMGGAMAAFGLLWRAYLSGRGGSWAGGLLTLLPPICLVQLLRPVEGVGLRPLWFVLSGLGLLGLFVVGQPVHRWVDDTFEVKKVDAPPAPAVMDVDTAAAKLESKADREEAKKALVKAGAVAEPAVRKLLAAKADGTVLAACDVLSEIGTAETVPVLRKLADQTPSRAVRIEATTAADAIDERLKNK
jgi:hypothetical protein